MKPAATLLALVLGGGSLACSMGSAPPMVLATTCSRGDLRVEIEDGHPSLAEDPQQRARRCARLAEALGKYRDAYEARFGRQDLAQIPIRLRATDDLRKVGVRGRFAVSGHAYADAIDLGQDALESFPHELNHVRTGPSHDGWCADYEPWSEAVLGIDQRGYLGCL